MFFNLNQLSNQHLYPNINLENFLGTITKKNIKYYTNCSGYENFHPADTFKDIDIHLTKHLIYRYCERKLKIEEKDIYNFLKIYYKGTIGDIYRQIHSTKAKIITNFFPDSYTNLSTYKHHLKSKNLKYEDHIFVRNNNHIYMMLKNNNGYAVITCYETKKFEKRLNGIPIR